uniref:Uncharacterized protein n=1 Tax=Zea mays TaxID=4577 RepID=C0PLK6_MAIZE|nr:unknown [Zea mays]
MIFGGILLPSLFHECIKLSCLLELVVLVHQLPFAKFRFLQIVWSFSSLCCLPLFLDMLTQDFRFNVLWRMRLHNPRDTTLHFSNGIWVLRFLNHFLQSFFFSRKVFIK